MTTALTIGEILLQKQEQYQEQQQHQKQHKPLQKEEEEEEEQQQKILTSALEGIGTKRVTIATTIVLAIKTIKTNRKERHKKQHQ